MKLRTALAAAIDYLVDGTRADKLLSATLSEVLVKMEKQAVEVKPKYALKMTRPQEIALVFAKEKGLFDTSQYQRITTGIMLNELQQKLG